MMIIWIAYTSVELSIGKARFEALYYIKLFKFHKSMREYFYYLTFMYENTEA